MLKKYCAYCGKQKTDHLEKTADDTAGKLETHHIIILCGGDNFHTQHALGKNKVNKIFNESFVHVADSSTQNKILSQMRSTQLLSSIKNVEKTIAHQIPNAMSVVALSPSHDGKVNSAMNLIKGKLGSELKQIKLLPSTGVKYPLDIEHAGKKISVFPFLLTVKDLSVSKGTIGPQGTKVTI